MRPRILGLGFGFLLLIQGVVNGGEAWPMYRGSTDLRGCVEGKLSDQPHLRWRFETEGAVRSSVAIVDGLALFGSGDEKVYALSLKDGKPVWSFTADGEIEASPLVVDGRVYIGTANGTMYALYSSQIAKSRSSVSQPSVQFEPAI